MNLFTHLLVKIHAYIFLFRNNCLFHSRAIHFIIVGANVHDLIYTCEYENEFSNFVFALSICLNHLVDYHKLVNWPYHAGFGWAYLYIDTAVCYNWQIILWRIIQQEVGHLCGLSTACKTLPCGAPLPISCHGNLVFPSTARCFLPPPPKKKKLLDPFFYFIIDSIRLVSFVYITISSTLRL